MAHLHAGGAERVMSTLMHGFRARRHSVELVLSSAEGELLKELNHAIRVVDLGAGRMVRALPRLARYLKQERPSALLATLSQPNLVAILARRLARVPTRVVVREANTPTQEFRQAQLFKDRIVPRLIARIYRQADVVVAVSRGVAESLSALGVPNPVVIYNPVLNDRLRQLSREMPTHPWFHTPEVPVVLGVGRLEPQKDFATLLNAFAIVLQVRPARLVIFGEGNERSHLERLAQSLGIADHVALPGFTPNPFPAMRHASVFVLSSRFEGLPNALIQAMACGCPVVSTDCPSGPREILDGGRYGHLVPVADPVAMAKAILEVLEGGGQSVPDEWLQQFEEGVIVEQYLRVLGAGAETG